MEQQFVSILRSALLSRWGIVAVVLLIGLLSLRSDLKSASNAKRKNAQKKLKSALNSVSVLTGCIFVAVILMAAWATHITIPVVRDINNESYCSVHGDFVEEGGRAVGIFP